MLPVLVMAAEKSLRLVDCLQVFPVMFLALQAKTIAASEWLRDRMSASIVWRASAVWIGGDKL